MREEDITGLAQWKQETGAMWEKVIPTVMIVGGTVVYAYLVVQSGGAILLYTSTYIPGALGTAIGVGTYVGGAALVGAKGAQAYGQLVEVGTGQNPIKNGLDANPIFGVVDSATLDELVALGLYGYVAAGSYAGTLNRLNNTSWQKVADEIRKTPKGERPDPSTYLDQEYIEEHLAQFDNGASIIMTEIQYRDYVLGSDYIGIQADGTQFVMPKDYCDKIANAANGDIGVFESALGFEPGHFSDRGGLVRIDISDVSNLNIRIPSGNEIGANQYWIPGGWTSGGVPEAVTDLIPNTTENITITRIE